MTVGCPAQITKLSLRYPVQHALLGLRTRTRTHTAQSTRLSLECPDQIVPFQHFLGWSTQLKMVNSSYDGQLSLRWSTQLMVVNSIYDGRHISWWLIRLTIVEITYGGQFSLRWSSRLTEVNSDYDLSLRKTAYDLSLHLSRRKDIQTGTMRGRLSWTGRRYRAETVRGRLSWFSCLLPEVQVPGSNQKSQEKSGSSRYAAVDPPIRSTTGFNLPPSICTRRLDGFYHGRNLLSTTIGSSPITGRRPAAAREDRRRRREAREEGRPIWSFWRLGTCVTLNGSGIQLAVGPQPLWLRNHNFGLTHRIMVNRLATSRHDPLGITDSACKNQLVVVSVHYGPFNTYIPIRSTTIGKSRVARDPIAMHTSWRSNSGIASVTRTNQYNQDLGLIHSTNSNHLESPNEGSSIDHQVTIHLHAQNITMFPTNETWYFTSQMLVSSSGGLILILTAQSTRNEFRMHSDY
ncbi:hypothetical protein F511_18304 [Dorcoceras hygrometricum]|uniref:Uncharacterized protein n=1 Tax=Dorcoceras hygrometricum TaxID=472368 RepID=A0A2Z7BUB3_9LAMI|nr:hypothetical protein F511_18304 [Dorcoceras hygrometricum]